MVGEILFWSGFAIIGASYFGYASWIRLLSVVRPRRGVAPHLTNDELPHVTCVMAAANEAANIERKLQNICEQDYPQEKLRIIVVSDASTDETDSVVSAWASRDPRVVLLRTAHRSGKPSALNLARPHIASDVVVLMDVRQTLTREAIRELVCHLQIPGVGAVSGDLRVKGDSYWKYEGRVRKYESRVGSMVQVTGSLYAIRRCDLPEIPPEMILDDVFVPLTVALKGKRIVMAEKAGSLDVVTKSVGSEFVRKLRTLTGLIQVCHLVDGCLTPGRNPIFGRFIMHKLSRLSCPYALAMLIVGSILATGILYKIALLGVILSALIALYGWLIGASRVTRAFQALWVLNFAAACAIPFYYIRRPSVKWARVEVDRV